MSSRQKQAQKQALASTSESHSTSKSKKTTTTGPYDNAFQQHLIDFGIYPDGYQYPDDTFPPEPENIDEIRQLLMQPRPSSPSPPCSDEDFRKFKQANVNAKKERQVTS